MYQSPAMTDPRWTKDQMLEEYHVLGFAYYMCLVERRSDGVKGTLDFYNEDGIRYYYNFIAS